MAAQSLGTPVTLVSKRQAQGRGRRPAQNWEAPTGAAFRVWRRSTGLSQVEAATWLGVSPRTVRHWERPGGRVPVAAFKLMKIRAGYALPDPAWDGWTLRKGVLWSPAHQAFEPAGMWFLSLTCRMAEAWKRDYDRKAKTKAAGSGLAPLPASRAGSPHAPGCPAQPKTDTEAANDPGLQEMTPEDSATGRAGGYAPASRPP